MSEARRPVHVRMQNAAAPGPFANEPVIDLTGWRGEDDFPAWREVANAVTERAGVTPPPPAPPRPPSGFSNLAQRPARAAPAPRPPQAPPQASPSAQAPRATPMAPPRPPAPAPRAAAPPPPPRPAPRPTINPDDELPKKNNLALIGIITFVVVAAVAGRRLLVLEQHAIGTELCVGVGSDRSERPVSDPRLLGGRSGRVSRRCGNPIGRTRRTEFRCGEGSRHD